MSDPTASVARRRELSELATKKVFRRLIPFLLLMYVIAFLDRSNVSFAQKEFEVDFGISAGAYAFGAGLFFVGYAIFEVPSNLLLHKVGARFWLARIMVTWGIIAAAFMFVPGADELLHPAVPARRRRGRVLSRCHPLPDLLDPRTAPEPGARLLLRGHRDLPASWVTRCPADCSSSMVFSGFAASSGCSSSRVCSPSSWACGRIFYLNDKPAEAKWLPDDERQALVETVAAEDTAKAEGAGPQKVLRALGNWRVWYFALIYFCIQIAVYGVTFFLPTQVTAITGQKLGFQASLVTAIPWVFALVGIAFFPGLADRTRKHRPIGTGLLLVTAVGIVISGALSGTPVLAIAGLSIAAMGFVAMQPIFWTLPTEYMTGFAAAAGIGLINSLGNLGGFLAPNLRDHFKEDFDGNGGLYALAVGALIGAILFASTALFKKANEIEAGNLDRVDAAPVIH